MNPKHLILLGAGAALCAAAAWVGADAFGSSQREPLPVAMGPVAAAEPAEESTPLSDDRTAPAALAAEETTPEPLRQQAADATSATIRGHVALSAEVVGKLRSIYVTIEEAIAGPGDPPEAAYARTHVLELGRRTPEFTYGDIPFSEYGYMVRAWAEGVNGSRQFARPTPEQPIADVTLAITEGIPFSVLLRDQRRLPVTERPVFLVPVGEPRGRRTLREQTDGFGSAVFETVLSGDYDVRVGSLNAPMNDPQRVHVQMHAGVRSTTVEVHTGKQLEVRVEFGLRGIEGASVKLLATDSLQLREYEGTTNWGGVCHLDNVLDGSYQLDVRADRFGPVTRRVTIAEGKLPEPVHIILRPTR